METLLPHFHFWPHFVGESNLPRLDTSVPRFHALRYLGPVVQNPINDNPRLKVNLGDFSTPRCCSTLIFGKALHQKKSILKSKMSKRSFHQKAENMKEKLTLILD